MKFASWMKSFEVFYQLISALVMTKKFLKNGNLLSLNKDYISKMVWSEDGAVLIRVVNLRLDKLGRAGPFRPANLSGLGRAGPVGPEF